MCVFTASHRSPNGIIIRTVAGRGCVAFGTPHRRSKRNSLLCSETPQCFWSPSKSIFFWRTSRITRIRHKSKPVNDHMNEVNQPQTPAQDVGCASGCSAEWKFDPVSEAISNKIRMGESVGFFEALVAINYQEALKRHKKERVWWRRLLRFLKPNASGEARHE